MKPLWKIVFLVLVVGLLMGMVPMALAAPGSGSAPAALALHFGKVKAPWVRSEIALNRGTVEGVGENRIILKSAGEKVEIVVNDETRYHLPTLRWEAGLEDIGKGIEVGDRVTVIARFDPENDGLIAAEVWVHSFHPWVDEGGFWQFQLRRLESVRGDIASVDEDNKTITIDNGEKIVLDYDDNTIFALRGFASLEEAAEAKVPAVVLYKAYEESKGTVGEARLVAVRMRMPRLKATFW